MRTRAYGEGWPAMKRVGFFGLPIVLLAVLLFAWRGARYVQEHDPRAILHRSIIEGADVPMRAELTMTWRRHGIAHITQAHVVQGAKGRSRTEYLLPLEARGRLVYSDGHTQWQYEPRRSLLATTTLLPEDERNERDTEDLVSQNYKIVLVSDDERVAGRRAYLLELLPRQEGKSSQKRWIDRETFKTLRIETHYPDGILARMVAYTSVTLPATVTPADFAPPSLPGMQRVASPPTSNDYPLRNPASSARSLGLSMNGALGFRLTQVASSSVESAQTAHLLYSDGIESISVFVQNGGPPVFAHAPGWHAITIRNRTAYENLDGHLDAIVWTQGRYRYTAVSHLGPIALQQFVGSQMLGNPESRP